MFETVRDKVFPFIKTMGETGDSDEGSTYTHHMKDALFMMPTARVLANVVDQLGEIDMADRDTKGDLYEYMLGKIATAGQNGQFRTPRPHHQADGRHDSTHPEGCHLRSGLRHRRLPGRRLRASGRAPRRPHLQGCRGPPPVQ